MDFSSLVAARVSEERKRLKLSQDEAGLACGVSREMWGRYERGKAIMGTEVLQKFGEAGADVSYVVTGVRHGQEHATPAAQLLRMKVLSSVLADELHKRNSSLPEVIFHELLDALWEEWRDDENADKGELVKRIGRFLK